MIYRSSYIEKIEPYIGKNIIKVLTGVRRCGKSTILDMIEQKFLAEGFSKDHIIHMNFEASEFFEIDECNKLIEYVYAHIDKAEKSKLIFDEIQEVEGWEKALNSFMVEMDADIYISGSNAHLLSSDLATYITGRYVTIEVFPLSFAEFLPAYSDAFNSNSSRTAFRAYLTQGGFPFQSELDFDTGSTINYLQDLFSTILFKDIVKRCNIRDVELLERLVKFQASEVGHLITVKNIVDFFKSEHRKVSFDTVSNYLNAMSKAYLMYKVERQDAIGKQILSVNDKWYLVDPGLRQSLTLNNQQNIDQVLENIVYIELLRRGYDVKIGKVGNREIDFIASISGEFVYIQVSYMLSDIHTREREFQPLLEVKDNYPKIVLSLDEFDLSKDGIMHQNLIDWLLENN